MFDETYNGRTVKKARRRLPWPTIVVGAVIGILVIVALVLAFRLQAVSGVKVPPDVAKKAKFALYVPRHLPGNYKLDANSFTITENTLVFQAEDSTGATIAFSEQQKPAKFDFDNFYKENMTEAKTIGGVDFPAVTGKTTVGDRRILSAVTGDTWVLVTTSSPLSDDDFALIAKSLAKQ